MSEDQPRYLTDAFAAATKGDLIAQEQEAAELFTVDVADIAAKQRYYRDTLIEYGLPHAVANDSTVEMAAAYWTQWFRKEER